MSTVRDRMEWADRRIMRSRIVQAFATMGGTSQIQGAFFQQPREIPMPGGAVQTVGITFECRYIPEIQTMITGDAVVIEGYGTFRFLRELLPGGDESGLTIIELGEYLGEST